MKLRYKYGFIAIIIISIVTILLYYRKGMQNHNLLAKKTSVHYLIPVILTRHTNDSYNVSQTNQYETATVASNTVISPQTDSLKTTDNKLCITPPINNRYVLSLSYWEQLTMATTNLCSLTVFCKEWNAKTVEPFTRRAEFWGLPSTKGYPTFHGMPPIYGPGPTKPLNSLYNMSIFNNDLLCSQYSIPPITSFEEFLLKADRNITILHFNFNSYGTEKPNRTFFRTKDHINCLNIFGEFSNKLLSVLNTETNKRNLLPFTVTGACCVNHFRITSPQDMLNNCNLSQQINFTIINTVWRGFSHILTKKFRLIVPEALSPALTHPDPTIDEFPLNDDILKHSLNYYKDFTDGGKDFLAVHFRTAKVAMLDFHVKKKYSKKCLSIVWKFLSKVTQEHKELPVKYFVDYGPYGSHSFEITLGKKMSKKPFLKQKINPLHYDPSIHGGWPDQGFVALLEQNTIAKAKVLVLIGGGSYQRQILTRFNKNKTGHSVHKLCWSREDLN